MKKTEDNNTLVFIVDIRADKEKIKDAVKKMYDIQTKKVNTLIRPDGIKCRHLIFYRSCDLDVTICTPNDECICLLSARSPQQNVTNLSFSNPTHLLSCFGPKLEFFKPATPCSLPAPSIGCQPLLLVTSH
ncbi:hypothetical protein ACSBR1_007579 [Camellia fascicularis]